ncbi:hypothetical protein [Streptomyces sp. NPDC048248]|uniref:hypothetical protein n=1 Tax=Streptomyces sp. NPDC048248 TaxID=3365523 RepID=UPI0037127DB7
MALEAEGDLEKEAGGAVSRDTPARDEAAVQFTFRSSADQYQGVADLIRLPDRDLVTYQVRCAEMPHWVGDADDLDQLGLLVNGRKDHAQTFADQGAVHQR